MDKKEEANLCMMVGQGTESSLRSNISFTYENYSTLLKAFRETHEEANRLANNRLKGLNNWLESKVKQ